MINPEINDYPLGKKVEVFVALPGYPSFKKKKGWQKGTVIGKHRVQLDRGPIIGISRWRFEDETV